MMLECSCSVPQQLKPAFPATPVVVKAVMAAMNHLLVDRATWSYYVLCYVYSFLCSAFILVKAIFQVHGDFVVKSSECLSLHRAYLP